MSQITNFPTSVRQAFRRLARALASEQEQAFMIGDLVNVLKEDHGLAVKQIAAEVGGSRQRLSEFRRTAAAFPKNERRRGVDFCFYTVSARAATRLRIAPAAALRMVLKHAMGSTREATAFLAQRIRAKEAAEAGASAALVMAKGSEIVDRCHHEDFRKVLPQLADRSVKLVVADPPYGTYGKLADGRHTTTSSTRRDCDGMRDAEARTLMIDLLRLAASKLSKGGCLILFRPGGAADPIWLMQAVEDHGWQVVRALAWEKARTKLGRGDEPYTVGTERVLVLARRDDRLINHDGSDSADVIRIPAIRPSYRDGDLKHLFEKPIELCRRLILKHTYPSELVIEPFGGTGPVSSAAAELGRCFVYCETNGNNFRFGSARVAKAVAGSQRDAG
jgi:DNA modification methylase